MPDNVPDFILRLEQARKDLNKVNSSQLNSQKRRNYLRKLVEGYFNEIRPSLQRASEQDQDIGNLDTLMQELLALCHKRGTVKLYQALLSKTRKGLINLDTMIIATKKIGVDMQVENTVDAMILQTLAQIVPSAALSYQQGLNDLRAEHRFSWRGPATDFREALRETLDHLAPDADVIAMPGFKQLPDTNGPTMKQKVRFVLKKRGMTKAVSAPAETATDSVDSAVGAFVRSVYKRSSVSTHTPTSRGEVIRIRDFVRVVLCELLEVRT